MLKKELSEADLHSFWKSSRYFSRPLLTYDGKPLEIVRRGRHNLDSGPDFKNATLRIQGRLLQGDVEIHLQARDWVHHGHHCDPAYNHVILHVSLDAIPPPQKIYRENGLAVDQILIPETAILQGKNVETMSLSELPLLECPLCQQSPAKIIATVQKAGGMRFQQKMLSYREQLVSVSWDQLLYTGLCEGLGYAKNQKPFRKLAEKVPIDLLFSELREVGKEDAELRISSILFGAAGLLQAPDTGGGMDAEIKNYLLPRQHLWRNLRHVLQIQPMLASEWQFFRLRPPNFPTRRLAAVVQWVLKFFRTGMLEALLSCVAQQAVKPRVIIKELQSYFKTPASGFWQYHYDFRSRAAITPRHGYGDLVGEKRADDLVINVVLPILAAYCQETHNAGLQNRIMEIYSAYPGLQENVITRKMRQQLFPAPSPREAKAGRQKSARFQQGLIHLARNYCRPLSCQACLALTPPGAGSETES